ncbi:hypothetical protein GCM10008939_11710 [Deinococcus aquiradiocola]|uniref:Uncharacterized protein n=1 Tax=Deinococcus aquiradiocola TaxID=393059 RepID=A0A917PAN3_9DEIO|nr:hypothetical protein GCM10008939_11710 [Deinococcus aquiradiocola]
MFCVFLRAWWLAETDSGGASMAAAACTEFSLFRILMGPDGVPLGADAACPGLPQVVRLTALS